MLPHAVDAIAVDRPATFVIVHGAGSGGWLWQRVRRLLQARGCETYTPTLTGVGERAHLANPAINLTTHLEDILGVLEYEDLRDVVLVGHSYGGMVVSGVADRAPHRLSRLVYVDAFVPDDGQSVLDLVPPPIRTAWEEQARATGEGWKLPPLPWLDLGRIGSDGLASDDIQRLLGRRVPQPFQTYKEPIHLANLKSATFPRDYVVCTDKPPHDPFVHYADRIARQDGWCLHRLATGHFPMLTTPGELTDLLTRIAVPRGETTPAS